MASTAKHVLSILTDINSEPADQIDTGTLIQVGPQNACHRFCIIPELALLLFEEAPVRTLINCQRVCKLWARIISNTEVLQARLHQSGNSIALTGKQQVVLNRNIDALAPPCQDENCIRKFEARLCKHCPHTVLNIDIVGAPHTGRNSLLRRICLKIPDPEYYHTPFDHLLSHDICSRKTRSYWHDICGSRIFRNPWGRVQQPPEKWLTRSCNVALLIYSVVDRESFEQLRRAHRAYLRKFRWKNDNNRALWIVIANKIDLPADEWQVSAMEGEEFGKSIGALFLEVSAKTGAGKPVGVADQVVERALYEQLVAGVRACRAREDSQSWAASISWAYQAALGLFRL